MINILIDTCSWINLVNQEDATSLNNLKFWIQNESVAIFTHDRVLVEWARHRERQRLHFQQNMRTKYTHTREVIKREKIFLKHELTPNEEFFDYKISLVDDFLSKAFVLQTSDQVKLETIDRTVSPRRAPFHNKIESTEDAYIIFSAFEYFIKVNQSFVFISANKSEFGAPSNPTREIHPELLEGFSNVQVEYYEDISRALHEMRARLPTPVAQAPQTDEEGHLVYIDKSKPLLDQLHDYLGAMHDQLRVVPPKILINHYPFKIGNIHSASYQNFSAAIANESVLNLFRLFAVSDEGKITGEVVQAFSDVSDARKKTKDVLKHMNDDLIFSISDTKDREPINIRLSDNEVSCSCPNCLFNRFQFKECFVLLAQAGPSNQQELIKIAYCNYHIGNYVSAANALQTALDCQSEGNVLKFIINYNLRHLSRFVYSNGSKNPAVKQLGDQLNKIDLDEVAHQVATRGNSDLINYIKETRFYSESKDRIIDRYCKIVDLYYSHLAGGSSSNSYVWNLLADFSILERFLNCNFIIYDDYTEFQDICNKVFEALIASHAIKKVSGSRFETFDDYILHKILFYADTDSLNKHVVRYKISQLRYSRSHEEESFISFVSNVFSTDYADLQHAFQQHCDSDNRAFRHFFNKVAFNAIILLSVVELTPKELEATTLTILKFLETEEILDKYRLNFIRIFLARIGKQLPQAILEAFFWIAVNNGKYHQEYVIEEICDIFDVRKIQFEIQEERVLLQAFIKLNIDGQVDSMSETLIRICAAMKDGEVKNRIVEMIKNHLAKRFEFEMFYKAAIYELVMPNDNYWNNAISAVHLPENIFAEDEVFGGLQHISYLDKLLNLAFKFQLDLSEKRFEKFRNASPYYDWLLDMDKFNYENFNPLWAREYGTRYYVRRMSECVNLKLAFEAYLKSKRDAEVEKLYYNIFVRKPWEGN
jgi:hypothetical protein